MSKTINVNVLHNHEAKLNFFFLLQNDISSEEVAYCGRVFSGQLVLIVTHLSPTFITAFSKWFFASWKVPVNEKEKDVQINSVEQY